MKCLSPVAAAAFVFAVLFVPPEVAARGAGAHSGRGFHHHHRFLPYGWVTYPSAAYVETAIRVSAPVRRCTLSRNVVIVPAEDGGERQITITRCVPD